MARVRADRRRWLLGVGLAMAATAGLLPRAARGFDAKRLLAAATREGPAARTAAQALVSALEQAAGLDEVGQLRAINDFFNQRIQFGEDPVVWSNVDYWASPLQTLVRGAGDCEDFAIAKYFSLLSLGMPARRLRLVYVRARLEGPDGPAIAHMVLAHYAAPEAVPTILDNLVLELMPANQRTDLTPVFSFNSEGLWEGSAGRAAGDPVQRLSRWRDVLARAREEGFR